MKIAKLTAVAVAGVLTFAACKYEEGPKISFRSKRDRVANEWKITKYEFQGVDMIDKVNQLPQDPNNPQSERNSQFMLIINFARTGGYGIEVVKKTDESRGYITNAIESNGKGFNYCCSTEYTNFVDSLPSHFREAMPHGTWTFDKGHTKIQVKPELSYVKDEIMTQRNVIDWGIVMLKEKQLKVKGRDNMDREWKMELKNMNSEPYWF